LTSNPWGRVDEDGTAWLTVGDDETQIGSWQAGTAEAGLAYYTRKYEDIEVTIQLFERRVSARGVSADAATSTIEKLRGDLDPPHVIGDLAALHRRLDALSSAVAEIRAEHAAAREAAKAEARQIRERLVTEAEELAESTQWKVTGDRFRVIVEEWKGAPRVERSTEQDLWRRLRAARATFDRRRRTHFAELEQRHRTAAEAKDALATEAEALASSTEWTATATKYRELMTQWKTAGQAGRPAEARLWQRFKDAQDTFFAARSAALTERDAGLTRNLEAKTALAQEAEALLPVTDLPTARRTLRTIQERWAAIGLVARKDRDHIEGRLEAVESAIRDSEQSQRSRNPEGHARAEDTVEKLRETLAKLNAQLVKADETGDAAAASEARAAISARETWLVEAERVRDELSG
jgi:hypothetical protein